MALIGEPATGKTSLAFALLNTLTLDQACPFKRGLLRGTFYKKESLFVFGLYEAGQVFAGTDRLSMGVQRDAEAFLEETARCYPSSKVFFEGDRLGTTKFLRQCPALELLVLTVSAEEKARRHAARGDHQTRVFLKGRKTKVNNILSEFPGARVIKNETLEDQKFALDLMTTFVTMPGIE